MRGGLNGDAGGVKKILELRKFVGVGWGASIVAHFARKVRATDMSRKCHKSAIYPLLCDVFAIIFVPLTLRAK